MYSAEALKNLPSGHFPELKKRIRDAGLLKKSPVRFTAWFAMIVALWTGGIIALFIFKNPWLITLDVLALALLCVQITFCTHEVGHCQPYRKQWQNEGMQLVCSFLLGVSVRWWVDGHNRHHANPNHEDNDPDLDVMLLTYSPKIAAEKQGVARWVVGRQTWFFFPLLATSGMSMRVWSIRWLLEQKKNARFWIELSIIIASLATYLSLLFLFLPPLGVLLFLLMHQLLWGLYLGMVFAPNHKGMPMLPDDLRKDFVCEQVVTARNVRTPLRIFDILYGGLNYQIEHHLFPTMPQRNLRQARAVVREFCMEKGIPYYETGFMGSCMEILRHVHLVSTYAR